MKSWMIERQVQGLHDVCTETRGPGIRTDQPANIYLVYYTITLCASTVLCHASG